MVSAFISINCISITDEQIFLFTEDLFSSGLKPALDVGLSVTRVGSAAQSDCIRVAGSYKLELAQYLELQAFSQFSAYIGAETKARLARGRRLTEVLKQANGQPIPTSVMLGLL